MVKLMYFLLFFSHKNSFKNHRKIKPKISDKERTLKYYFDLKEQSVKQQ